MENGVVFDYHYEEEAERYAFFRIPKALYTEPMFHKVSDGAKVLYGQMLDLMSLSRKHGWIDEEGRVYIRCSIKKIKEIMNCSNDKAVNMLKELDSIDGVGLIEKLKLGQGKATIIYVKSFVIMRNRSNDKSVKSSVEDHKSTDSENQNINNPESGIPEFQESEIKNSDNQNSRTLQTGNQEFCNAEGNNITTNKSNSSDINSINPSYQTAENDMMDAIRKNTEIIKTNIDYDTLLKRKSMGECERIEEILDIIVDFISIKRKTVKIEGVEYPYERVKVKLLKLDMTHIEYVLESLDNYTKEIAKTEAFLITALYNASKTINHAYNAKLNHDIANSLFDS